MLSKANRRRTRNTRKEAVSHDDKKRTSEIEGHRAGVNQRAPTTAPIDICEAVHVQNSGTELDYEIFSHVLSRSEEHWKVLFSAAAVNGDCLAQAYLAICYSWTCLALVHNDPAAASVFAKVASGPLALLAAANSKCAACCLGYFYQAGSSRIII
jgi:hypothetical protein